MSGKRQFAKIRAIHYRGVMSQFHYSDLIEIFEQTFSAQYNTKLVKGDDEPIYLPADQTTPYHRIVFAHGFFASALHEISHWLVAGKQRRALEDFGYWYCPDGRTAAQQAEFEQVEIKPQALEWALCVAVGKPFKVSCDNLHGSVEPDRHAFRAKIYQQVQHHFEHGFPKRCQLLLKALSDFYQTPWPIRIEQFEPTEV